MELTDDAIDLLQRSAGILGQEHHDAHARALFAPALAASRARAADPTDLLHRLLTLQHTASWAQLNDVADQLDAEIEAMVAADSALVAGPALVRRWFSRRAEQGRLEEAAAILPAITDPDEHDFEQAELIDAYADAGRFDEALDRARAMVESRTSDDPEYRQRQPNALANLVTCLLVAGDVERARLVIAEIPEFARSARAQALAKLAVILLEQGHRDEAVSVFAEAGALHVDWRPTMQPGDLYDVLGELSQAGLHDDARDLAVAAAAHHPAGASDTWMLAYRSELARACAQLELGNVDELVARLRDEVRERAGRLGQRDIAQLDAAEVLAGAGRWEDAAATIAPTSHADTRPTPARQELATVAAELADLATLPAFLERAAAPLDWREFVSAAAYRLLWHSGPDALLLLTLCAIDGPPAAPTPPVPQR